MLLITFTLLFSLSVQQNVISTVAGICPSASGILAKYSNFRNRQVAVDSKHNIFVVGDRRILKIDTNGIITWYAGNGVSGYNGDNIPATQAQILPSDGLVVDSKDNLYISDYAFHRIRRVDHITGIITTYAGTGSSGYNGDNIPAIQANLDYPAFIAMDGQDNLYIIDNYRIRKIDNTTKIITTIAGNGTQATYNAPIERNEVLATSIALGYMLSITADSSGNVYITDNYRDYIRKVNRTTGMISLVAGNGISGYSGENVPANSSLNNPNLLAIDSLSNALYVTEGYGSVRKIDLTTMMMKTVAGGAANGSFYADNVTATSARFSRVDGLCVDQSTNQLIVSNYVGVVSKVDLNTNLLTIVVGKYNLQKYNGDNILASDALLNNPTGIKVDARNNWYIVDSSNYRLRKVDGAGIITTVAGNGTSGIIEDNVNAAYAKFNTTETITVDAAGNIYFSDFRTIRKVNITSGMISTVAGGGTLPVNNVNLATLVALNNPKGITISKTGTLIIADAGAHCLYEVNLNTQIISVFAGVGIAGYPAENETAAEAQFNSPYGLALDSEGNIYVADSGNNLIRRIDWNTKMITIVVGGGASAAENVLARLASVTSPRAVVVDANNNLYFIDYTRSKVRKLDASTGLVVTIAGTGIKEYSGTNISATSAALNAPQGLDIDMNGNLLIADTLNHQICKVSILPTSSTSNNNPPSTAQGSSSDTPTQSTTTSTAKERSSSSNNSSAGAVIAVIVGLALIGLIAFLVIWRFRRSKQYQRPDSVALEPFTNKHHSSALQQIQDLVIIKKIGEGNDSCNQITFKDTLEKFI